MDTSEGDTSKDGLELSSLLIVDFLLSKKKKCFFVCTSFVFSSKEVRQLS